METKLIFIVVLPDEWKITIIHEIIRKMETISESCTEILVCLIHGDHEKIINIHSKFYIKSKNIHFLDYSAIDLNTLGFLDSKESSILVTFWDSFLQREDSIDKCIQALINTTNDVEYINHNFLMHPELHEQLIHGTNYSDSGVTRFLLNDDITDGFTLILKNLKTLPGEFPAGGGYFIEKLYGWLLEYSLDNTIQLTAGYKKMLWGGSDEKDKKNKRLMQDLQVRKFLEVHTIAQIYPEINFCRNKKLAERDAHFDLGVLMIKRESALFDQALLNFQELLREDYSNFMVINNCAYCYFYLSKAYAALGFLEASNRFGFRNEKVQFNLHLIQNYNATGKINENLLFFELFESKSELFQVMTSRNYLESNHSLRNDFIGENNSPVKIPHITSNNLGIPLVSVIIPTYNREKFLEHSLMSLSRQEYDNFEVVIVNDAGSSVVELIEKYKGILNIQYFEHQKNQGLAATRNTGIDLARGKYISYLDDDDVYYFNHISLLTNILENSNFKIAYSDCTYSICSEHDLGMIVTAQSIPKSDSFNQDLLYVRNITPVICVMHEKECNEKAGSFDTNLKVLEDWDLWIRMSQFYEFIHLPFITADYRVRDDQSNMTADTTKFNLATKYIYNKYHHLVKDNQQVIEQQKILNA